MQVLYGKGKSKMHTFVHLCIRRNPTSHAFLGENCYYLIAQTILSVTPA